MRHLFWLHYELNKYAVESVNLSQHTYASMTSLSFKKILTRYSCEILVVFFHTKPNEKSSVPLSYTRRLFTTIDFLSSKLVDVILKMATMYRTGVRAFGRITKPLNTCVQQNCLNRRHQSIQVSECNSKAFQVDQRPERDSTRRKP